ncbi:hypothetical protein E2C01_091674 [Portunus trituberculatus]|uniref:Uncharacterized protein n=1 Tax=Portunus trituberculatus TaxID=210409 RepID=A0A5B7JQ08_PORTR|nr:hypothetical protein [Portunus trituberculatus]
MENELVKKVKCIVSEFNDEAGRERWVNNPSRGAPPHLSLRQAARVTLSSLGTTESTLPRPFHLAEPALRCCRALVALMTA